MYSFFEDVTQAFLGARFNSLTILGIVSLTRETRWLWFGRQTTPSDAWLILVGWSRFGRTLLECWSIIVCLNGGHCIGLYPCTLFSRTWTPWLRAHNEARVLNNCCGANDIDSTDASENRTTTHPSPLYMGVMHA